MPRKSGIWLDKKQAIIVHLKDNEVTTLTIESGIESFNPIGGSRSKTAYGPVITVKEKSYLQREKQQSKKYFDQIISEIRNSASIYICGPAETKNRFKKHIDEDSTYRPKIIGIDSKDSMTDNQIVAEIKAAFSM